MFNFRVNYSREHLHLNGVHHEDEGVYTCQADNTVGSVSRNVTFKVVGKDFLLYLKNMYS